jgi:hypothetical protein
MPHVLSHHSDYLQRYGFWRWLLRECVRANPLYVISAALIAYGVLQLNTEIDPQIGKEGGIIATLAILHSYEIAVLFVAMAILRRRTEGGRDLHGLMLVAALFLGGSFIALDEQIALTPSLGLMLVCGALLLAAVKITVYAAQSGMVLPRNYRICILIALAGHTVSPLLGHPRVTDALGMNVVQGLAWLTAWLSLTPILWLMFNEQKALRASRPENVDADMYAIDRLRTRWCGGLALFMIVGTSIAHLLAADWVFDRPGGWERAGAEGCIVATILIMLRWPFAKRLERWMALLLAGQAVVLQYLWAQCARPETIWNWELLLGPAVQYWFACAGAYVVMALMTRRVEFLFGLPGPAAAPVWSWISRHRSHIPHFRALISSIMGFVLLIAGMFVSMYRERLLRWLDPVRPAPPPTPILPPDEFELTPPSI